AAGLEGPARGGVGHAIASGPPGRWVEPIMTRPEEELDQHASQRPQKSEQRRLELEERRGSLVMGAVREDLVEPLVGSVSQALGSRRTARSGRITLTVAHGDRLLTVPVWDLFSGQDKSPERYP